MKFDRHSVNIRKGATNAVPSALPSYATLALYAELYNTLNRAGKAKDNVAWKAAIADRWEVSSTDTPAAAGPQRMMRHGTC